MLDLKEYTKFDSTPRMFIKVPGWCGGYGLAPVNNPVMRHALPERKPGKRIETTRGMATIVRTHNCQCRFWFNEGVLLDSGIFYRSH